MINVETYNPENNSSNLYHYEISGLKNYWLSSELYEIGDYQGEETITILEIHNIDAAIGMHLCQLDRKIGPREVRFLRLQMAYNQKALGEKLGYKDGQMVGRAEQLSDNYKALSDQADLLLRLRYLAWLASDHSHADYEYKHKARYMMNHEKRLTAADDAQWAMCA